MTMETVTTASRRLRALGFDEVFRSTEAGTLRCERCGEEHEPEAMTIAEIVRYEGASDPGDSSILVALTDTCGARGLFLSAYGPDAPRSDARVLRRLASGAPLGPRPEVGAHGPS